MICYDREFPESARILALQGAEIVLVPNACVMDDHRIGQLKTRAFENKLDDRNDQLPWHHPDCNGCSLGISAMAFGGTAPYAGDPDQPPVALSGNGPRRGWRRARHPTTSSSVSRSFAGTAGTRYGARRTVGAGTPMPTSSPTASARTSDRITSSAELNPSRGRGASRGRPTGPVRSPAMVIRADRRGETTIAGRERVEVVDRRTGVPRHPCQTAEERRNVPRGGTLMARETELHEPGARPRKPLLIARWRQRHSPCSSRQEPRWRRTRRSRSTSSAARRRPASTAISPAAPRRPARTSASR